MSDRRELIDATDAAWYEYAESKHCYWFANAALVHLLNTTGRLLDHEQQDAE